MANFPTGEFITGLVGPDGDGEEARERFEQLAQRVIRLQLEDASGEEPVVLFLNFKAQLDERVILHGTPKEADFLSEFMGFVGENPPLGWVIDRDDERGYFALVPDVGATQPMAAQ